MGAQQHYLPIILLIAVSTIFISLLLLANYLITSLIKQQNPKKKIADLSKHRQLSPYECGLQPCTDARFNLPVKFALVAILFIIFDVELIFLFPWAVISPKLTLEAKLAMGFFLLVLTVGFAYGWKKGALDW
jgi:NADH-quinone oxidoreductase subunit A